MKLFMCSSIKFTEYEYKKSKSRIGKDFRSLLIAKYYIYLWYIYRSNAFKPNIIYID